MNALILRNKNMITDLLRGQVKLERIQIVDDLKQDTATKHILELAKSLGIPIQYTPYQNMPKGRDGKAREVIVAYAHFPSSYDLEDHIYSLRRSGKNPFFVVISKVEYPNNIGAIIRTAFGAGVNGILFQGALEYFCTEDTVHYSLGTILKIPLIKINMFEALKILDKENVYTYALDMKGEPYYAEPFKRSCAFVLGAEKEGLSETITSKCKKVISIPMQNNLESLNVAVSAGIILFEKIRPSAS